MPPALELVGVSKRFGNLQANSDVSLVVERGSIHGIVGENGAGKSTLMSMIYGLKRPDSGDIRIDGRTVQLGSPRDALAAGIGMVHQHFQLIEAMTALENILLGAERGPFLRKGRAVLQEKLAALARDYGLAIDPDAKIADLPIGMRQRVEILKALTRNVRILVLDEPTAVLTPDEADELFRLMRQLRDDGVSILFITHKLREVLAVTNRVSVMRQGAIAMEVETARTTVGELAEAMMGRTVSPSTRTIKGDAGRVIYAASGLSVVDATGATRLNDVSLELHAGEIVGVAGVSGNGQTELMEAMAGMRPLASGVLTLDDAPLKSADINPRTLRMRGVMHAPEDRSRHGLLLDFPARESAMLGFERDRIYGGALLDPRAINADCETKMRAWDVRPVEPALATRGFSGGNQQKLVLAREVERDPRVLLVGQPTRGVDIGAIESIHARLLALREAGKAILLVSSELDEILSLSDRILVMCGGRIVGERRAGESNARELGLLMAGVAESAA